MLLYRVIPYLPPAAEGTEGHPSFLPEVTGRSRVDNPRHYRVWYLAMDQAGAVAETLGDLAQWSDDMFEYPALPGSRRCLVTYQLEDDLQLLDLDDANELRRRALKPTQVMQRNRAATQTWARDIFDETDSFGERRWQGIRWWSYHRPQWRVIGYWGELPPEVLKVEHLDMEHPAVHDAGRALRKSPVVETAIDQEFAAAAERFKKLRSATKAARVR